jgi:ABC-2 type transport system permease protein
MQVVRGFLVVAALVCAFLGVGLWISVAAPSEEKALLWSLFAWLFSAALHDFALIGLLLRTDLPPGLVFLLAGVNPVEAARVALLSNVDAQLAILGPVGFFISNKLGTGWAFAAGVVWPALCGVLFAWRAMVRLQRRDMIA